MKMDKLHDVRRNLIVIPDDGKQNDFDNNVKVRQILHVNWDPVDGKAKNGKVVAIGINPSTAHKGKSDNTLSRLCRLIDMYGYNDLTMLNLFESISPCQDDVRGYVESTETDFSKYIKLFNEAEMILVVWGLDIKRYSKQVDNATAILKKYSKKLYCIQDEKKGTIRKPLHPSRISYDAIIDLYNI